MDRTLPFESVRDKIDAAEVAGSSPAGHHNFLTSYLYKLFGKLPAWNDSGDSVHAPVVSGRT